MSRSVDRSPVRRDDGFTLLEVVVALGVTTLVMVALLPQLVVGLRSTGTANVVTHSKGVVQAELEHMRNLPFHVAPSAGGFADVLDRYYPDLVVPTSPPACSDPASTPPASWTGYVGPTSTARCSFEPATGAFYRTVRSVPSDRGQLMLVVATQFLSGATPPAPVTPRAGYDTRTTGRHLPASSQIGVTATVAYRERGRVRPVTTYTQVVDQPSAPTRVLADARATALEVGSVTADGLALSLSAGLVNAAGAASSVSTSGGSATSVTAGLATGEQGGGARATVQAPPTQSITGSSSPAGELRADCGYACWSASRLGAVTVSAQDGLPRVGSSNAPLQAGVSDSVANAGVTFATASTADGYRPALQLQRALVRMDPAEAGHAAQLVGCAVDGGGVLTASGYLHANEAGTVPGVDACAVARTRTVSVLPTTFAPPGVLRIRLDHAWARCIASADAGSASHDYRAVVEVWNGSTYDVVATVVAGQTADPLAAVPMETPVGEGHTLGEYVASWSSPTAATVRTRQASGVAEVSVPGVVTIASQPVRLDAAGAPDPASAVSMTLGAVSCSSEDGR